MSRLKANILIGLATVLLVAVLVGVYFSIQRYRQLESNLSGLENINTQLSLEKESLESKLARYDIQLSDLTRERQSRDQELTRLINAKNEMESRLRSQSAVLEDQVSALQGQLTAYEKEREELVVSRQSMEKDLQRTIDSHLQHIKALENQLTSQDKKVAGLAAAQKKIELDLSEELVKRDKLVLQLQERLDEKETELSTSQKLYDKAIEERQLTADELSDKIGEITLLREQFKDLERKREAEAQFYTKTLNEYKERLIDRDKQISDSAEHIETFKAKEHDLIKKLGTAAETIKKFEREREELVVSRQSMEKDLQRTIDSNLQHIKALENQLTTQDKTVAGLAAAKKELELDLSEELVKRDKQVSELQEQLDKNEAELSTSQKLYDKAIEERQLTADELSDKIGEITLLREQFKDLEKNREAEAQFYTKTLNEYKERLIDRDKQISDSAEHIETFKAKEHDLIKKLGTAVETIKKFERERAATDEKIAALQNEIQRRDTQLNEANTSVTQLIDSQKELEDQITQTRSAMQKEEAEKSEVWDRLLELQKNMKDRGQNLKQLHARLTETEKEKREAEESVKRMKETYNDLVAQFQTEIASKEATIDELEEKLSITFVQDILFNLGQTSISVSGRQTLEKIGTILKRNTTDKIVVMGHSDNLPITKEYQERYPTNWELSAARAAAVVRYFQHTVGIDPRQMEAVGHSFYKPVADNDTPENRAKNRRVEIFVMPAH